MKKRWKKAAATLAAEAIMTTDTIPKAASRVVEIGGKKVTLKTVGLFSLMAILLYRPYMSWFTRVE